MIENPDLCENCGRKSTDLKRADRLGMNRILLPGGSTRPISIDTICKHCLYEPEITTHDENQREVIEEERARRIVESRQPQEPKLDDP